MNDRKVKHLMIDSGAFSSWRKGDVIDIGAYAEYLIENQGLYDTCVNLDVIPGGFGREPNIYEVEESAAAGWENLKYLESRGLRPIPVFHQGEPFKWLRRLIDAGYEYIGISPDNSKWINQKQEWLDRVFSEITNDDGQPVVKTHGFAVTAIDLMFQYPWFTVDSISWVVIAAFGSVLVPKYRDGMFRYDMPPHMVQISSKSASKDLGKHFDGMGGEIRKHIEEFFGSEKFTIQQLQEDFYYRSVVNARVLKRVERTWQTAKRTFLSRNNRLSYDILSDSKRYGKVAGFDVSKPRVVFAVNMSAPYSHLLTVEGIDDRLFTYFLLKDTRKGFLDDYVRTGLVGTRSSRSVAREHEPMDFDIESMETVR